MQPSDENDLSQYKLKRHELCDWSIIQTLFNEGRKLYSMWQITGDETYYKLRDAFMSAGSILAETNAEILKKFDNGFYCGCNRFGNQNCTVNRLLDKNNQSEDQTEK